MGLTPKRLEEQITKDVADITREMLKHEPCELVDVEYRKEPNGWVLRILIDREGGVTIADCTRLSRQLSDILDVKDIVPYSYNLEVSSPGINRPLRREKDYISAIGETISLKTGRLFEGRRNYRGKLVDFRQDTICLELEGERVEIPREMVKKAVREYDFSKDKKRGRK